MRVWELIRELHRLPAGKEVFISPLKGDYSLVPTYITDNDDTDPESSVTINTRKEP
jgi:hypothetical protein